MVAKPSAGLLVYREVSGAVEVLLVHPGGPLWARKDDGAWSIPKGELDEGEEPLAAARREFAEETGIAADGPAFGDFVALDAVRQPGGKLVHAYAVRGEADAGSVRSNTFAMEWPPKSGRQQAFAEVDRAAWFLLEEAEAKILRGQAPFLDQLREKLRRV